MQEDDREEGYDSSAVAWRMDVMLGASRPARGRLGAGPTVAQARTYLEDLSRYRGRRSGGESFGPAVKYVVYRVETGSSPPRQKLEPDLGRDGTHPATGGATRTKFAVSISLPEA
jgi:hypothetical protein